LKTYCGQAWTMFTIWHFIAFCRVMLQIFWSIHYHLVTNPLIAVMFSWNFGQKRDFFHIILVLAVITCTPWTASLSISVERLCEKFHDMLIAVCFNFFAGNITASISEENFLITMHKFNGVKDFGVNYMWSLIYLIESLSSPQNNIWEI